MRRPAHTPSLSAIRCCSQRPTPTLGTTTTSCAKGSRAFADSSASSASPSRSIESSNLICSATQIVRPSVAIAMVSRPSPRLTVTSIRIALSAAPAEGQSADAMAPSSFG